MSALEKMETSDNKHLENYGDQSKEDDEYWEKVADLWDTDTETV